MKKLLSTLICLVASLSVWAYEFEVDGICYDSMGYWDDASQTYKEEAYVTYYSYDNDYIENRDHYVGDIVIPEKVEYKGTEYEIVSVSSNAFYNCNKITSVSLPKTIKWIDYNTFNGCTSLTSITLPNSITSIGSNAFYNCTSLTSITLPNSITSIDSNAFYNCTSLTSITLPNSITRIGSNAFYNCI